MTRTPNYPQGYFPRSQMAFKVTRNRRPTGLDYRHPDTAKYYDISTQWQVGKNPTDGVEGEIWILTKIVSNVAYWVQFNASTAVLEVEVDLADGSGVNPVDPDVNGLMTVSGTIVAAHSIPIQTHTSALNSYNIEVQYAEAVGVSTPASSGLSHFNDTEFTVDANGFVSLSGGGVAITSVKGDDGAAVVPTAGVINLTGIVVANATHAKPLYFVKNATSIEELDLQITTAVTTQSDSTKAGIASFDSGSFVVSSNGWVTDKFANYSGFSNIGFSYSGGTFTITGAQGTALSATNIAYITFLHNTNESQLLTLAVSVPYTLTDAAGTNEIGANLWGTTTAVAWGNDCPFYLYAICDTANPSTDVAFGISRIPHMRISPVAGNIAVAGTTAATTQGSMYLLKKNGSNPTVANFASMPTVLIGSFRMQKSGANAWTIQTLNFSGDGVGNFNESTMFNYPVSQNGATNSTHFTTTAGFPTWGTKTYTYFIYKNGILITDFLYGNLTVNGTNASEITMTSPMAFSQYIHTMAMVFGNNVPTYFTMGFGTGIGTSTTFGLRLAGGGHVLNTDITGTDAASEWSVSYTGTLSLS